MEYAVQYQYVVENFSNMLVIATNVSLQSSMAI